MNHRWVLIRNLKMVVNITNLLIFHNLAQLENKCTYCSSITRFIFNLWREYMVIAPSMCTHRIMYRDILGKWSILLTFLLHYYSIKCGVFFFGYIHTGAAHTTWHPFEDIGFSCNGHHIMYTRMSQSPFCRIGLG
jgi:hypothetical protein